MKIKLETESESCINIDAYSEPSPRSKKELSAKIVNNFQPLTVFAKSSILHVRTGSEYASEISEKTTVYKPKILSLLKHFIKQEHFPLFIGINLFLFKTKANLAVEKII